MTTAGGDADAGVIAYAIIPPVSPWDEKHRELICMDLVFGTLGRTPAESWRRLCIRPEHDPVDALELTRRVRAWYNRGYRLQRVTLKLIDG